MQQATENHADPPTPRETVIGALRNSAHHEDWWASRADTKIPEHFRERAYIYREAADFLENGSPAPRSDQLYTADDLSAALRTQLAGIVERLRREIKGAREEGWYAPALGLLVRIADELEKEGR